MTNRSRYLAFALVVLIILAISYYFSSIVAYIVIAWVLSLVGQPIMAFFKRRLKIGKFQAGDTTCAVLTLATFVFIVAALVAMFVPTVIQQARNLAGVDYASLVQSLEEPINDWNNWFVEKGFIEGEVQPLAQDSTALVEAIPLEEETAIAENSKNIPIQTRSIAIDSILQASGDTITQTHIILEIALPQEAENTATVSDPTAVVKASDTPIERIQKRLFSFFNPSQIPNLFSSVLGFFGNLMVAMMSIFFITFFFLKEKSLFPNFVGAIVPKEYEKKTRNALTSITNLLTRYFGGVLIQVTTITLFVSVSLGLLGIENALLIGFFAALINVIPYVGPIIGAAFGMFIVISSNLGMDFYDQMLPLLTKVFLVFACMQMLDNFLLQPFIFSNSVSAHPLEIFIIILVGAELNGVLGMVLAIPVYTVLRVIARSFLSEFRLVQTITGGIDV